jgi:hypothetical protein
MAIKLIADRRADEVSACGTTPGSIWKPRKRPVRPFISISKTGQPLREYLDEKRAERRRNEEQVRQASIREQAEKQLQILTGLPIKTTEVRRYYRYDKEGDRILMREEETEGSPKLAEVIMRGLQFGLGRLDPERYGAKVDNKHTHMVFSLSDLRRARDKAARLANEKSPT